MSEKRFFTKVNHKGRLVIIDSECHMELFDMTLACEVLNRLDTKRRWLNDENEQLQKQIRKLEKEKKILKYNVEWFSQIKNYD